uniref:ApeC domain-containing protein n=1 Tax=Strongyloides papillosus TaxID=174720 RepID=A0A0N5BII6_STREA
MKVSKILTVFIILLISTIYKIYTVHVQVRVYSTPLCPEGRSTYKTENVTAEIRKDERRRPKNTTIGPCGFGIFIWANLPWKKFSKNEFYVNFTYSVSHKNITKRIPDDCNSRNSDKQRNPDKTYHFLCNLGLIDPNPKNEPEHTTPVSDDYYYFCKILRWCDN